MSMRRNTERDLRRDTGRGTVVGVFSNHEDAQRAVQAFRTMGFTDSEIGIATQHDRWRSAEATSTDEMPEEETYAGEAAAGGAAAGAGIGALWGLGILAGALPAVGPAIAGGTLAILFSSAVAGAATGGLAGALIGMGVPKDEAQFYESELQAGRTIVTVEAGARHDEVTAVMRQYGGYDIQDRGERFSHEKYETVKSSTAPHIATPPVTATEVHPAIPSEHRTIDIPVMQDDVIERRP
jgi:hypothetical protein